MNTGINVQHLSCAGWACPINLTGSDRRCQKRQQTEDQTYIKLGPGRLGALMETHQQSPVSLLSTAATWDGEAIRGRGRDTVILRNRRNLWQLLSESKHLRKKTAVLHLAHFCSWGCVQFTFHNYACSFLQFGAVPNSNTQLIPYTCRLPHKHT
jgi:hypothetical protein